MVDGRMPVVVGGPVVEGDRTIDLPAIAGHIGCGCCGGRDPLAVALAALHLARVRDGVVFSRVVIRAHAAARARVAAVLTGDPVTAARFRLVEG